MEFKKIRNFCSDKEQRVSGGDILLFLIDLILFCVNGVLDVALWVLFSFFVVVVLVFSLSLSVSVVLFLFTASVAFLARVTRHTYSCCRESPYWRSVELRKADRESVSAPLWGIVALVLIPLYFRGYCLEPSGLFVFWIFYDWTVDLCCSRFAELFVDEFVRPLLSKSENAYRDCCDVELSNLERRERNVPSDIVTKAFPVTEIESFENESLGDDVDLVISEQKRVLCKDGNTRVTGLITGNFDDEMESAVVYITFCPPFKNVPNLEIELGSSDDIEVRKTLALPYGARFEVKRRIDSVGDDISNSSFSIEYVATDVE